MQSCHTPHDVVFQLKSKEQVTNMKNNQQFWATVNVHFHPDLRCLKSHSQTLELRHLQVTDDVLKQLTREQLESLHAKDMLKYIIRNKHKVRNLHLLVSIAYINKISMHINNFSADQQIFWINNFFWTCLSLHQYPPPPPSGHVSSHGWSVLLLKRGLGHRWSRQMVVSWHTSWSASVAHLWCKTSSHTSCT